MPIFTERCECSSNTPGFGSEEINAMFTGRKIFTISILRQEDDLAKLITYILNNPVRAGICERWNDYPFKGSTVFDLVTWTGGIL